MKFLDKFISFIFSIVMLVVAITVVMLLTGYASLNMISDLIDEYILGETYRCQVLLISSLVILAALKTTMFNSDFKAKDKSPIIVGAEKGNVEISQETIVTTVRNVANSFPNVKDVQAKMSKAKKGIKINVNFSVVKETNIRKLTEEMQDKVRDVIRDTTGIEVLVTNIKVKNLWDKEKKVEEAPNKVIEVPVEEIKENGTKDVEPENTELISEEDTVAENNNENV